MQEQLYIQHLSSYTLDTIRRYVSQISIIFIFHLYLPTLLSYLRYFICAIEFFSNKDTLRPVWSSTWRATPASCSRSRPPAASPRPSSRLASPSRPAHQTSLSTSGTASPILTLLRNINDCNHHTSFTIFLELYISKIMCVNGTSALR